MPRNHALAARETAKDIAVIVPDGALLELVKTIQYETEMEFSLHVGLYDDAVAIAHEMVAKGTRILVSRGETTKLLRSSGLSVPILDIPITEVDITNLLMQARQISNRIAVAGFGPSTRAAAAIRPLLDAEVEIFRLESVKDIPVIVDLLVSKQFTVVVGNPEIVERAQRKGIAGFPIISRKDTVLAALDEAVKLSRLSRSGMEWHMRQKAVLESIREHVFLLDSEGLVLSSNLPDNEFPFDIHPELQDAVLQNRHWSGTITQEGQIYICKSQPVSAERNLGALLIVERTSPQNLDTQRENVRKGFVPKVSFADMLYSSAAMRVFVARAKQYSRSNAPVLIQGESGTGKEYVAQSIHGHSRRQHGPFVSVSCAAIPEQLLESELFGYHGGAFTGASRNGKRGLFELAHTGTIFLDEVGELPLVVQAKILRVLEESSFLRIGGDRLMHVDIRVIAATNKNLAAMVRDRTFRDDLFFRLAVLRLEVPPLRERHADIGLLLDHYINVACEQNCVARPIIPPETLALLETYAFPGNVRELRSLAERLAIACHQEHVTPEMLTGFLDFSDLLETATPNTGRMQREEAALVRKTLAECGNNRSHAARMLGIAPSTLWRKCKQLGISGKISDKLPRI